MRLVSYPKVRIFVGTICGLKTTPIRWFKPRPFYPLIGGHFSPLKRSCFHHPKKVRVYITRGSFFSQPVLDLRHTQRKREKMMKNDQITGRFFVEFLFCWNKFWFAIYIVHVGFLSHHHHNHHHHHHHHHQQQQQQQRQPRQSPVRSDKHRQSKGLFCCESFITIFDSSMGSNL